MEQVWYASYGSNLSWERFRCYLRGGRPDGAARMLPGARDSADPTGDRPVLLDGSVSFAWESPTWGGGIAFFDPDGDGTTFGRAYRLTVEQFADVASQEMHRDPAGGSLDLVGLAAAGSLELGPGRYETLHLVGQLDEVPVVTFSSHPSDDLMLNAPGSAYLTLMIRGLAETHGLAPEAITDYLAARPGCRPGWTRLHLSELVAAALAT